MGESKQSLDDDWLERIVPLHRRLTDVTVELVRSLLDSNGVPYLSVNGRTKSIESINEKLKRKSYKSPKTQMTDVSGIRIITYLESQVEQALAVMRTAFEIDESNSLDRKKILGFDRVGYRSAHLVCTLGNIRSSLLEYKDFKLLKFEIQIRTVLQHAWAELAHDRTFKFSPGLPQNIQRKLNLYSGMLEVVDSAFDGIAREIEEYSHTLSNLSGSEIEGEDVNRLSLEKFLTEIATVHKLKLESKDVDESVLRELQRFGVDKVSDLSKLITSNFISEYRRLNMATTGIGFLRDLMMYTDIDKYFSRPIEWAATDRKSTELLIKKWGKDKVYQAFDKRGIFEQDDDLDEIDDESPSEKDIPF